MKIGRKLTEAYFDFVYNPVYDFTTGRLAPYYRLQHRCIGKLKFDDGDRVLCVGVGTGNEITHILKANSSARIVGVDCSNTALRKARQKALAWGKEIAGFHMDAQSLGFATESFDKVLCLHVMDFVADKRETTAEIFRVLRKGGQFVITYPSRKEGVNLGINLLKENIRSSINSRKYLRVFSGLFSTLMGGIVYLPLTLRPEQKSYSRQELETIFGELASADFRIEDYPVYCDFVVYGRK